MHFKLFKVGLLANNKNHQNPKRSSPLALLFLRFRFRPKSRIFPQGRAADADAARHSLHLGRAACTLDRLLLRPNRPSPQAPLAPRRARSVSLRASASLHAAVAACRSVGGHRLRHAFTARSSAGGVARRPRSR